jgi:hypothetical protein
MTLSTPAPGVVPSLAALTLSGGGSGGDGDDDACPLLDLLQKFPDFFLKEVLERLDPTDLTMLAQVGQPWLAAVLASGLPRLPRRRRVRLQLKDFCSSGERLGLTLVPFSAQL